MQWTPSSRSHHLHLSIVPWKRKSVGPSWQMSHEVLQTHPSKTTASLCQLILYHRLTPEVFDDTLTYIGLPNVLIHVRMCQIWPSMFAYSPWHTHTHTHTHTQTRVRAWAESVSLSHTHTLSLSLTHTHNVGILQVSLLIRFDHNDSLSGHKNTDKQTHRRWEGKYRKPFEQKTFTGAGRHAYPIPWNMYTPLRWNIFWLQVSRKGVTVEIRAHVSMDSSSKRMITSMIHPLSFLCFILPGCVDISIWILKLSIFLLF